MRVSLQLIYSQTKSTDSKVIPITSHLAPQQSQSRSYISTVPKESPLYADLERGANIIWHKYYKQVRENNITLLNCIEQLNKEYNSKLEDARFIQLYVKHFGHHFILEP